MRRKLLLIALPGLLGLAWMLRSQLGGDAAAVDIAATAESAGAAALTVTVSAVQQRPMQTSVVGTGTVTAWQDIPVAAEATGLIVTAVLVDEGVSVRREQLLARLSDQVLRAQIQQQEASIAEAQATLRNARADLQRGQELAVHHAISKENAEQRATAAKTAEARLLSARAGLSRLEAQLAQTCIVAPDDGYISKRSVVLGQVVQPGTELFRIVRDGRLEVDAQIPEANLFGVVPGQPVSVIDPTGRTIDAQVRDVAPLVDAQTRLGTVRVALPPESGLKPGMFARVEISTGKTTRLAVPQESLVWREGGSAVFALGEEQLAALRPVVAGARQEGWVEILEGLAIGERVIVRGAGFLNDGDQVRIEPAQADLAASESRNE